MSDKAPDHTVGERRQIEPEQRLRAQQCHAPGALREQAVADDAGIREARQQQRIGPHQDADRHPGQRAARGGAPPDQAAEKSGRKLRDRRKRQQPDRGELRLAGQAVIHIGEKQDDEDRHPPDGEQQAADIRHAR